MARFDYFVMLAEMRTGSNFLEANLNCLDGVSCLGEAFNPHFMGYPNGENVLGITHSERETDPLRLIDAVRDAPGLNGFRFFSDHDPRVSDIVLADPRCAKIVLTRNPAESYVSRKIAARTGQWKLTNATHARTERVEFDLDEFDRHLSDIQAFQIRILNALQRTGQTAFYLAYEDLQDIEILNGLASWLGVDARIASLDRKLKKQNPMPMAQKVENLEEMSRALGRTDRFDLARTPNFEPRRGPLVPTWVAAAASPLVYMTLKSGPTAAVEDWMARLDGVGTGALRRRFTQTSLRDWLRDHPGHVKFAVVRHPVAWAHTAFCERIVSNGPGTFAEIRKTLRRVHGIAVPDGGPVPETDASYDLIAHRSAFLAFLIFLRRNLSAQTAVRSDAAWASQSMLLQGVADFGFPDTIARETTLGADLSWIAGKIGQATAASVPDRTDPLAPRLAAIYDRDIEEAARAAYGRDYETFGFVDYAPSTGAL